MRRVVVTGLGMVSPVGHDVPSSWEKALRGITGVAPITLFDTARSSVKIAAEVKGFDASSVMDAKELRKSSRFIQMAVFAAKEALTDSGLPPGSNWDRIGSSIGVGIGAIQEIEATTIVMHQGGPRKVSPFFIPYVIANMAAGIVANTFNLRGPNICTCTACTSGTHAVGEAFMYIRNNMADAMVCGGSEAAICELTVAGFGNMKALSKQNENPTLASRPFDKDRDGFVLGEGAGVLVLEEYEYAKKRGAKIYAEVIGYGMSGDAYHITSPAPEGEGAQRCMRAALESAQISPDAVQYINAHGTSTYYNDIHETQAICKVFGNHAAKLAISSTKGVTGHCLGAAGGIEAVFLAKSIADGVVPPTANLVNVDPECTLDYTPGSARTMPIRVGLSNSFGFGGTNGTLVMSKV